MCIKCGQTWHPPTSGPPYRKLDREMLRWALYCTGPTGWRQLVQHLEERGVLFTGEELRAALASYPLLIRKAIMFGGEAVELVAPPGHGLG
jgi:hypothetical protein